MKKIIIIDGGPRKNMNTAKLLLRFAEGANSAGSDNSNHFGTMEWCITTALGEPQRIVAYNTTQVAKYDNYELGSFSEEAKLAWRDAHWEEDLQKAFEVGRQMAEQ